MINFKRISYKYYNIRANSGIDAWLYKGVQNTKTRIALIFNVLFYDFKRLISFRIQCIYYDS